MADYKLALAHFARNLVSGLFEPVNKTNDSDHALHVQDNKANAKLQLIQSDTLAMVTTSASTASNTAGIGGITDAESASGNGSLVALLKRLRTILADVWDGTNHWFRVLVGELAIIPIHKTANTIGDTAAIVPSAPEKAIRLWWYNLGADPANGGHVVAALKFGAGGTPFYKTGLSQYGAATAHSFKAGRSFFQGAAGETLFVNLSAPQTVYGNFDYEEVAP